jgi:hypothetical protein
VLEQRARQLLLLALALMMIEDGDDEEEEGELMNSGRKSLEGGSGVRQGWLRP